MALGTGHLSLTIGQWAEDRRRSGSRGMGAGIGPENAGQEAPGPQPGHRRICLPWMQIRENKNARLPAANRVGNGVFRRIAAFDFAGPAARKTMANGRRYQAGTTPRVSGNKLSGEVAEWFNAHAWKA